MEIRTFVDRWPRKNRANCLECAVPLISGGISRLINENRDLDGRLLYLQITNYRPAQAISRYSLPLARGRARQPDFPFENRPVSRPIPLIVPRILRFHTRRRQSRTLNFEILHCNIRNDRQNVGLSNIGK